MTKAHRLRDRQSGEGLAMDPPVRDIATAAKRISIEVSSLRRSYGTAHGRVVPADTIAEHAELAADAAVLWCRWALRRLDFIVEGRSVDLLRDLREGTLYRGDLRRRLIAADITSLSLDEQRRLGITVGRRAFPANVQRPRLGSPRGRQRWAVDRRLQARSDRGLLHRRRRLPARHGAIHWSSS
jgi:hypothetical protein